MSSAAPLDPETRAAFEEAVTEDGIPQQYVRVLDADISEDGLAALVLLELNPGQDPYPMISFCECYDGEWAELVSTEALDPGANWTGDRWVSYVSGEAPEGAKAVHVRQGDRTRRRPVVDGLYVVAFWFPPGGSDDDSPDPPVVEAFD